MIILMILFQVILFIAVKKKVTGFVFLVDADLICLVRNLSSVLFQKIGCCNCGTYLENAQNLEKKN